MTALVPMVRQVQRNCRAAGVVDDVNVRLADNGYASAANFDALTELPLLVAVTGGAPQVIGRPDVTSISAAHRPMADRPATPGGRRLYKRRAALVEPGASPSCFSDSGAGLHYCGRDGVDTEVKLLGLVHNLNKRHAAMPTS
ncbi:hypothetical protein [Embleya sp. NPDC005575]|uniref:hypothetical protein n=1 Tax=Embleya sp. NPDC005575 TaxID=3156892 RepID=UPI0033BE2658